MKNDLPVKENIIEFMPVIRMLLSDANLKIIRLHNNSLVNEFCSDRIMLESAVKPVGLKSFSEWDGKFIYLDETFSPEKILDSFRQELSSFKMKNNEKKPLRVTIVYRKLSSQASR
jgi:hypothetical protein